MHPGLYCALKQGHTRESETCGLSGGALMKVDPQQFIENGYVIVRDCVPPERLDELRDSFEVLVDRQRAIWRREKEPNDPPGGVWDTHQQPRVSFDTVVDEPTANTIEFCLHENTMGVARQLMRAPDVGMHQMAIMCNPVSDHGPDPWHRDVSPASDAPVEGLADGYDRKRSRICAVEYPTIRRQRPVGGPGQPPPRQYRGGGTPAAYRSENTASWSRACRAQSRRRRRIYQLHPTLGQ